MIDAAAIAVRDLTFAYAGADPVLRSVSLTVPAGARCLLIGANGAGKTTLLRILGGRHMVPEEAVRILGEPAFHATHLVNRVAFIGGQFPFNVDVTVSEVLAGQSGLDLMRLKRVLSVLDVDLRWRMNRVSDGQRRRVQVLLHLARPLEVILLDEVTADLDVLARADLLALLHEDSVSHGTTFLYATHVLDGLESWATHLAYLRHGQIARMSPLGEIPELVELQSERQSAPLLRLCERWLRQERGTL
jgi:CCR4-NOT complex subunit CAF16